MLVVMLSITRSTQNLLNRMETDHSSNLINDCRTASKKG